MRSLLTSAVILVAMSGMARAAMTGSDAGAAPVLMDVRLQGHADLSRLKPGSTLRGTVNRGVYSGPRLLVPAGCPIRLTVSVTERRRREGNDRWPWAVRLFMPRQVNSPSSFSAAIALHDGTTLSMPVSLASTKYEVQLIAQDTARGKPRAGRLPSTRRSGDGRSPNLTLVLVARPPEDWFAAGNPALPSSSAPETLPAGTVAHVALLDGVRASRSHAGDGIEARLMEPLMVDSRMVLPEGARLRGEVVRSVPPRWLSRSGSLSLRFTELRLPTGASAAIIARPSAAVVDRSAGLRMDPEGGLKAGSRSKVRMLMELGVAGGFSKVADDSFQLVVEAIISTATDASTAGTAKIAAAAVSGLYMVTRHGRDVRLPPYTRMDIAFERATTLPAPAITGPSAISAHNGQ